MEFNNELDDLIADDLEEVRRLNDAFTELDGHISKEAEYTGRLDKVARIDAMKSRLVAGVNRVKREEDISEREFNASKGFNSIAGLALGSIVGAMIKQNPSTLAFKSFSNVLDRKVDFGNVMITAKEYDGFEDIKVISISRLAREAKTTEAKIISSLEYQGYSLITPEEFWQLLDLLKEEIMDGKYNSEKE